MFALLISFDKCDMSNYVITMCRLTERLKAVIHEYQCIILQALMTDVKNCTYHKILYMNKIWFEVIYYTCLNYNWFGCGPHVNVQRQLSRHQKQNDMYMTYFRSTRMISVNSLGLIYKQGTWFRQGHWQLKPNNNVQLRTSKSFGHMEN